MTTPLDDKLVPVALNLIEKFGADATFHNPATKTFDPTTNEVTKGAVTDTVRKMSPPDPYTKEWINGKTIILGDSRSFIAASGLTFTPTVGNDVTFKGEVWKIIKADPLYSGELVAAYWLQLRRTV